MQGHIAKLVLVMILVLASPARLVGEDTYFVITTSDPAKRFNVTAGVVASLPSTTYETVLPGMDEAKHKVKGPLMRDLLKAAGMAGTTGAAIALDLYEVEIPVADFSRYDVIAAIELDGKPMTVRTKGPAWIVYPASDNPELLKNPIYENRSIWQLKELSIR